MLDPRATEFVDAAIAQMRRLDLMMMVGEPPDSMRVANGRSRNDWREWQPTPSTVTNAELDALEQEVGMNFPPVYRDFLKYQHYTGLTEIGVRFFRHLPGEWKKEHLFLLKIDAWRESLHRQGLLPFGDEANGIGPACFDTTARLPDGDCPVVCWDHEWGAAKRTNRERTVRPLFSSCGKMFECLTFAANTDVQFTFFGDENETETSLVEKRELLAQFLAIDPEGAGGRARDYWTRLPKEQPPLPKNPLMRSLAKTLRWLRRQS